MRGWSRQRLGVEGGEQLMQARVVARFGVRVEQTHPFLEAQSKVEA